MLITRKIENELRQAANEYPIVTVLGPRQSGKSTLAQMTFPKKTYLSLEDPDIRMLAGEDPRGFLNEISKGAILDEIQRVPDLLSYLQTRVDRNDKPGQFILTGSHQPELHQAISQTLAGRTSVLTLLPFNHSEIRQCRQADYEPFGQVVDGAYPRLHHKKLDKHRFFSAYMQTYVERDVRALLQLHDIDRFQVFLRLTAGRIGQILNYTSLSNDIGVSSTTVKNWLAVLKSSFIVFELPPFFENIRKRLTKSPKLFFCDIGLVSHLLGINTIEQFKRDPLRGNLYKNLIILEILKTRLNHGLAPELFFYRDSHGNEVDLIIRKHGELIPIEIKSAATFTPEHIKGIEHFRSVAGDRCGEAKVCYNGEKITQFKNVRITNPFIRDGFDFAR